jgi:hypothetical protein
MKIVAALTITHFAGSSSPIRPAPFCHSSLPMPWAFSRLRGSKAQTKPPKQCSTRSLYHRAPLPFSVSLLLPPPPRPSLSVRLQVVICFFPPSVIPISPLHSISSLQSWVPSPCQRLPSPSSPVPTLWAKSKLRKKCFETAEANG